MVNLWSFILRSQGHRGEAANHSTGVTPWTGLLSITGWSRVNDVVKSHTIILRFHTCMKYF